MRGQTTWSYTPYSQLCEFEKRNKPYICRIAPYETSCEIEWFDKGSDGEHFLICHQRGAAKPDIRMESIPSVVKIEGLLPGREYEVKIARTDDPSEQSDYRFFRAGEIIGTVVNYLHPHDPAFSFSGSYLCSPCIVRTKTGRLLVSMDVYGPSTPQNLSFLYKSDDDGKTWQYLCDLLPCFWGKLFLHQDRVYLLSTTAEYGELQIGYSDDDGETWHKPVTLFPGSGQRNQKGMHQAPNPVIHYEGRIWTAVDYGSWERGGHESAIVSVAEDCDLMDPGNWTCSDFLPYNRNWPGALAHSRWGGHEGNAVVGPDGEIYNFIRYQISNVFDGHVDDSVITNGKAFMMKLDKHNPEKQLVFDRFVDFNGGMSKFDIRFDEKSGKYISLVNKIVDNTTPGARNLLSLSVSSDLVNWTITKDLIDATEYSSWDVAFQYVSFIIDGDDILYASRTAFNGARRFHDSNYITFHRLENFRQYL